jgi:hypothetical protein
LQGELPDLEIGTGLPLGIASIIPFNCPVGFSLSILIYPLGGRLSSLPLPLEKLGLIVLPRTHHFQNLGLGFEQPAGIADIEIEELIDKRMCEFRYLLALHVVVIEEEGIIALLEDDEPTQETLLEEGIVRIEIHQHLHALIRDRILLASVIILSVKVDHHLRYDQIVVPQFIQKFADFGEQFGIEAGFRLAVFDEI